MQPFLFLKGILSREGVRQRAAPQLQEREEKNMVGKKNSRIRVLLAASLITCAISGCGGSGSAYSNMADAPAATEEMAYESYDSAAYDAGAAYGGVEAKYAYDTAEAAEEAGQGQNTVTEAEAATQRKLIKTVNISAETEDFDTLIPGLQRQVESLGGYIENISVYDTGGYYVEEQERQVTTRHADLTARVPKEKLDGFLAQVDGQTNVTSRSENVEDVTLQYVDLESHKKALLTEQDRLLELLKEAESVEDIIAIEGRLSEVRYQLESMESQLRTYDNKIDYSTVYLSIQEVRQYSPSEDASVGQRIVSGFKKSLKDVSYGIREFAISFVIHIPYIVLWIVIIAAAIIVWRFVRRFRKKRAVKRMAEGEEGGGKRGGRMALRRLFKNRKRTEQTGEGPDNR